MHLIFSNNARSTLAGSITNVSTTAVLAAGTGALFPQPIPGQQYFKLSFTDAATGVEHEIVHVTAITGDTITMVRGQEGTSARPWLAGDKAEHLCTAGSMATMVQFDDLLTNGGQYVNDAGTANQVVINLTPVPDSASDFLGAPIRVKKIANGNTGAMTVIVNGTFGPYNLVNPNFNALANSQLPASALFTMVFDGTQFMLQSITGAPFVQPIPLTTPEGGTGQTAFAAGNFLVGNGTGPISVVGSPLAASLGGTGSSAPTANAVAIGNGASALIYSSPSGTYPLRGTGGQPAFGPLDVDTSSPGGGSTNLSGIVPAANVPVNIVAVYPTPGSYTFTPVAHMWWVYAQVTGGGGGGAGSNSLGPYAGGGGGAGGHAEGWVACTPGVGISVTVGAKGTFGVAGAGGSDGGNGGSSSFGGTLSATGGSGGQSVANVAGGLPGAGTSPTMASPGGYGQDGNLTGDATGAGGGGASFWGGGVREGQATPASPAAFGSGGGGGYGATNGSEGMPGIVVVRG